MPDTLWDYCVSYLQSELPAQQFNTWIRPLRAEAAAENTLRLVAPNRFVLDWVNDKFKARIIDILNDNNPDNGSCSIELVVASKREAAFEMKTPRSPIQPAASATPPSAPSARPAQAPQATQTPDFRDESIGAAATPSSFEAPVFEQTPEAPFEPSLDGSTVSAGQDDNIAVKQGDAFSALNAAGNSSESAPVGEGMFSEAPSNAVPQGFSNEPAPSGATAGLGFPDIGAQQTLNDIPVQYDALAPLANGGIPSTENVNSQSRSHYEPSSIRGPGNTLNAFRPDMSSSTRPSSDGNYNESANNSPRLNKSDIEGGLEHKSNLNSNFVFDNFVVGKSNQLGLAAATQVAENPGGSYNPLFIYGGVGLGKTHLMHAVGNALCTRKQGAKVVYLHSERFVADMVKALQLNAINDFKRYYRSVDALLIDDIQFFAGKERSQEEFFHTFNALLEGGQQIIVTCDRYPKEIDGLEERLKSRFGWGLTVAIEPPELETRVAILKRKADQAAMNLPNEAAFFIAQRIRSNVRELEGALKRVIANAHFTGREISVELVRESLKDLLALQDRLVSIDNIQRIVAEYYKIKVSDLHSKRRSRSVARPRQVAMYLAKDLTHHSLPEIGEVFGGRDHTTVLHACRKIKELLESDADIKEDVKNLLRTLTT